MVSTNPSRGQDEAGTAALALARTVADLQINNRGANLLGGMDHRLGIGIEEDLVGRSRGGRHGRSLLLGRRRKFGFRSKLNVQPLHNTASEGMVINLYCFAGVSNLSLGEAVESGGPMGTKGGSPPLRG